MFHARIEFAHSVFWLFKIFFVVGDIQGAELAAQEGKSAAALAACRTLAEELTEMRFPAPRILAFKVIFVFVNLLFVFHTLSITSSIKKEAHGTVFCLCIRRGALKLDILFLG